MEVLALDEADLLLSFGFEDDIKAIAGELPNICQVSYFSKVLFMVVTLRRKYTRVMTFENVWQGQFHCLGCGICRVGFRENYFHCDTCVACLPLSLKGAHKCIKESLRVNCPVCLEVCVCV